MRLRTTPPAHCARSSSPHRRTKGAHSSSQPAPDSQSLQRRTRAARSTVPRPGAPIGYKARRAIRTWRLPNRNVAAVDERFDGVEQLAFLVGFTEVVIDAKFYGSGAMFFAD